jgi:ATP-binding protein involved in chromosome partitioning
MTGERILVPETIDPHVYPVEIRYVGRYGLQFLWSDGHSTGIYPFEFLRKLADAAPTGDT